MLVERHTPGRRDGAAHRRRPSLDHVLVAIGLLGIVIAVLAALWDRM